MWQKWATHNARKKIIFFYKSHIRWSYKNAKDITRKPNSHSTGCQYIVGQHPFFSSGKNLTSSVNLKIYISSAYHQFFNPKLKNNFANSSCNTDDSGGNSVLFVYGTNRGQITLLTNMLKHDTMSYANLFKKWLVSRVLSRTIARSSWV